MRAITIAMIVGLGLVPVAARAQDVWAPPSPPPQPPPPPAEGAPAVPPAAETQQVAPAYPAPPPPAPMSRPPLPLLPEGAHFASPGEVCYPAPPPGETHDGFYLRLQIGGGYVTAKQGDTSFSGGGIAMGFALGAILLPDLALFGTFIFHAADDPRVTTSTGSMTLNGDSVGNDSFGAGLAYYLEPVNVYAAAAVLGTEVDLTDTKLNRLASSNTGVGFSFMVGKEWWVGREWGLGAAGEITGAWMTDADDKTVHWSSFTYSILFSATYN